METKVLIDHTKSAIEIARHCSSGLPQPIIQIKGMVCRKTRHFLNAICSLDGCRYLEIGSWQGASLVSAMYGNNMATATAIDNFCRFDPEGKNKRRLELNIFRYLSNKNVKTFNEDCWSVDLSSIMPPFNIYFYDGSHLKADQERAFTHFNSVLSNPFVTIIDDWQSKDTRDGTNDAFAKLNYNVVFDFIFAKRTVKSENCMYIAVIEK